MCDVFQAMSEEHVKLKKVITSAPIEQLDAQGQKLLKRINGNNCDADSGFSGMCKKRVVQLQSSVDDIL